MSHDSSSNDPYRPPSMKAEEAISRPAALAKWERNALGTYLKHRDEPIRFSMLTLQTVPSILILGVIIAVPILTVAWLSGDTKTLAGLGPFGIGILIGFFFCSYGINRRFARFWPTLRECLDWQKIEEKLEPPASQTSAQTSTPIAVQVIEPSEPESQTPDP